MRAVLVAEIKTGNVLAYVGNTDVEEEGDFGEAVDVIMAPQKHRKYTEAFSLCSYAG